eukprot:m.626658 g.626658  ORF g.626658 m.626658 type:complete len:338 (+) comp58246_c0_seq2:519-1532(+)
MLHMRDVEATGGDSRGHQDGGLARTEGGQSKLALALRAIAVNGGRRVAFAIEEVLELVGALLGLDEHEDQGLRAGRIEQVQQAVALLVILNPDDLLSDVLAGGTNTTNCEEDVVREEVTGKHLNLTGERGAEHERHARTGRGHGILLHNAADLRLETHVKHAISLVQNKVSDVVERNLATFHHVDQTTGRGNEKVATALDLAQLGADVSAAVDAAQTDLGAVGDLASLVVDLRGKLASRGQDQRKRVLLASVAAAARSLDTDAEKNNSVLPHRNRSAERDGRNRTGGRSGGPSRKMWVKMGIRKAAVFPEPVWAQAMRSRRPRMIGMACFCTGVGLS